MISSVYQEFPVVNRIGLAFLFLAMLISGIHRALAIEEPNPSLPAQVTGGWTPNGVIPAVDWIFGTKPALWGSWSGSDEQTGTLTIGPFRAPRRFLLAVSGFPKQTGNVLFLRRISDGAIYGLWSENSGDSWTEFAFVLPPDWAGQQVEMCATDNATGAGGWFGVSEPYNRGLLGNLRPYWNDSSVPRIRANTWSMLLFALLASAVVLLAPGIALWPLVRRRLRLPDELGLLVAIALSALIGYGVFWVYFFSPAFGPVATWVILVLALGTILFRVLRGDTLREVLGGPEVGWAATLMAGIGLFYLGLLLLPQMKMEVSFVAQRRWFDSSLPPDNTLPQLLAEKVASGDQLRPVLILDWQSSDRPPLQAGWQLFARAPLRLLFGSGANATDMRNQIAGMILQLSWVPALWGFLRVLGLSQRESFRLLVGLAPSGFLLLNSMFVWPKLGAAAFTLGAFTLLLQLRNRRASLGYVIAGAGLAALAYLSHGATMFALLALGIVLLIPRYFLGWKCTLAGAAVFLLLNLPWLTFQKFYDPPGNRLIKWHIGGSMLIDTRGVFETMIASYSEIGLKDALERKRANLVELFGGSFRSLASVKGGKAATDRRVDDFYFTFRSAGWWNLGWLVGLAVILGRGRRVWNRPDARQLLLACGVLGFTLAIWVLLMFGPSTTVIHQGTYFANLLLLVVPAVILMRTSALLWVATAIMNAAAFFVTYLPRTAAAKAHLDWMAIALAVAAAFILLAIALRRLQAATPLEAGGSVAEARDR